MLLRLRELRAGLPLDDSRGSIRETKPNPPPPPVASFTSKDKGKGAAYMTGQGDQLQIPGTLPNVKPPPGPPRRNDLPKLSNIQKQDSNATDMLIIE